MSFTVSTQPLSAWLQSAPPLGGAPETDAQSLAEHVQASEGLLHSLAPKPARSHEQTLYAASIHEACRALRHRFMALHAEWLYNALTQGFTNRKSLHNLVFEAAECCPGLVPTAAQIGHERTRLQRDKEGYEIDQGIFFHGLFRVPKVGTHLIESARQPTARSLEYIQEFRGSGRLDLGSVLIERQGCAAYLTVNNQRCLNAEDDRLVDDMETAVDLALLDDAVRVGVVRGGIMTHPRYAGRRVFSAGINLKALHTGQISFVDFLLRRELGYVRKIAHGLFLDSNAGVGNWRELKRWEKPWIACVDGFAIGGGAQLLLVFDCVIAASESYFSLPAAQEGIIPGFSNLRLVRFLGSRKARQVILGGRKIWAHEPDARLWADEIADSTELDAIIERSIERLSKPAVIANRHMLNLAEEPPETFLQYASEFSLIQAERLYSQDVLDKIRPT